MAAEVVVDGAQGEGGGQVLRTSLALAALLQRPVRVVRIRAGRPKPGLRPQHAGGVRLLAEVTGGRCEGARPGATEVAFQPGPLRPGAWRWDVGTAGSLTLLLQAALPVLLASPGTTRLHLRGGTDVAFSPTWAWFTQVWLPRLAPFADALDARLLRRGFYPAGGGEVEVTVRQPEDWDLAALRRRVRERSADAVEPAPPRRIGVHSVAEHRLPGAARLQAEAAVAVLRAAHPDLPLEVAVEEVAAADPGGAVAVWLEDARGHRVGADRLGAAEPAGRGAAQDALADGARGTVDRHLADHWVPWVGLGAGAVRVPERTGHLVTNVEVVRAFLGDVVRLDGPVLRGVP